MTKKGSAGTVSLLQNKWDVVFTYSSFRLVSFSHSPDGDNMTNKYLADGLLLNAGMKLKLQMSMVLRYFIILRASGSNPNQLPSLRRLTSKPGHSRLASTAESRKDYKC